MMLSVTRIVKQNKFTVYQSFILIADVEVISLWSS